MQNDWILDVLADLKSFATANEMVALAEQLDDASLVASAEMASLDEKAGMAHDGDGRQSGQHTRIAGGHQHA